MLEYIAMRKKKQGCIWLKPCWSNSPPQQFTLQLPGVLCRKPGMWGRGGGKKQRKFRWRILECTNHELNTEGWGIQYVSDGFTMGISNKIEWQKQHWSFFRKWKKGGGGDFKPLEFQVVPIREVPIFFNSLFVNVIFCDEKSSLKSQVKLTAKIIIIPKGAWTRVQTSHFAFYIFGSSFLLISRSNNFKWFLMAIFLETCD